MNPYAILGILGVLLAFTGLGSWAVWERGDAMKARADLSSLKASYASAALSAETHAKAVEAKQDALREARTVAAIQQVTYAKNQAQLAAATYRQKLAQLAGKSNLDLGHQCAVTPIPSDLVPK